MATQKSASQPSEQKAKGNARTTSPNDTAPDGTRIDPKAAEEGERRLRAGRTDDAEPEEDLESVGPTERSTTPTLWKKASVASAART
jgi:hypothetical protein